MNRVTEARESLLLARAPAHGQHSSKKAVLLDGVCVCVCMCAHTHVRACHTPFVISKASAHLTWVLLCPGTYDTVPPKPLPLLLCFSPSSRSEPSLHHLLLGLHQLPELALPSPYCNCSVRSKQDGLFKNSDGLGHMSCAHNPLTTSFFKAKCQLPL